MLPGFTGAFMPSAHCSQTSLHRSSYGHEFSAVVFVKAARKALRTPRCAPRNVDVVPITSSDDRPCIPVYDEGSRHKLVGPGIVDHSSLRQDDWPSKSSLFILRSDGQSCSRELVTAESKLHFAYPSSQQHLLIWKQRPKTVMVFKKLGNELLESLLQVVTYLGLGEHLRVVVEPQVYSEIVLMHPKLATCVYTYSSEECLSLADYVDFVVCLGGDGVILHATYLFGSNMPPVISFNMGSLGFLTNHVFDDHRIALSEIIYGRKSLDTCTLSSTDVDESDGNAQGVMVTLRMRLSCAILRRGCNVPEQVFDVLNEVVIDRGSNSYLTNIECYEHGRFITRVQADGVMLATPTGSTAYSVAAGGSLMHPNVPAILLTPICPHSLSFRPVVLPDYADIELRIPDNARCSAWVCFDGRSRQQLLHGDSIRVRMSENPVPTINNADLTTDWFDGLERCFRWSDRLQQKPFEDRGSGRIPTEEVATVDAAVKTNGRER